MQLDNFYGKGPGDETRRYGDYFYKTAGAAIEAGQAVTVDASGEVVPTSAASADVVFGVAYIPAEAGDEVTVKTNGGAIGQVEHTNTGGTVDVGAGDTVGAGTSAGTAGVLDSGGDRYLVLEVEVKDFDEDGTAEAYAELSEI